MSFQKDGYVLAKDDGDNLWFFNSLASVKIGAQQSHGAAALIELHCPPDFGPPPHTHDREDEAFYVLDGELTVVCGEQRWEVGPGGLALLPRQIRHAFTTGAKGVRMLQLTMPAQFEAYARELGVAAATPTLPEARPIDVPRLLEVSSRYGIQFHLPAPA